MRNWITFFTILIVQKEFTVSLLCFAFLLQCLERWKGCLKPVLKRDLKTVPSRTGLMRIAVLPCVVSCTMRFHLRKTLQHGKTFKRGASCGSHDFLGSARGWGLTLRWFFDWKLHCDFWRWCMSPTSNRRPHRIFFFLVVFWFSLWMAVFFVPKENGKVESRNVIRCSKMMVEAQYFSLAWLVEVSLDCHPLQPTESTKLRRF